jgi:hypothetical protein
MSTFSTQRVNLGSLAVPHCDGYEVWAPGELSIKQYAQIFDFVCVRNNWIFKCYTMTNAEGEGEGDVRKFGVIYLNFP